LKIYPQRIIIIESINPCREIDYLKNILLYSLLLSHAIRIDTTLYIRIHDQHYAYKLSGFKLKHLYAQESSLRGFTEKLFCGEKLFSGTYIVSEKQILDNLVGYNMLIYEDRVDKGSKGLPNPHMPLHKIIIIDEKTYSRYKYWLINNRLSIGVISNDTIRFIIAIHHLIDAMYGGWIRRYGRIEYREGLLRKNNWFGNEAFRKISIM
jgi:hypothetical protein